MRPVGNVSIYFTKHKEAKDGYLPVGRIVLPQITLPGRLVSLRRRGGANSATTCAFGGERIVSQDHLIGGWPVRVGTDVVADIREEVTEVCEFGEDGRDVDNPAAGAWSDHD